MKKALKWGLIAVAVLCVAAVVILAVVLLRPQGTQTVKQPLADYLDESWATFHVEQYDEATAALTLAYDTSVSYEQACKYGADSYAEVALGHVSTIASMKVGASSFCGVTLGTVTVNGYSSDGAWIYTVTDDGTLSACWQ